MKQRYLTLSLFVVSSLALATDYTWSNGAGTMAWGDAGNWTPEGVPGTGDNITFTSTGIAADSTISMGGDRSVKSIKFGGGVPSFTLGEPTSTLTVESGTMSGGWQSPKTTTTLAARLHLVTDTTVASYGAWGMQFVLASEVFDDGNGYGILSPNDQNQCVTFCASNTYTGATVLHAYSHTISGPDGTLRNSPIILDGLTPTTPSLVLDNSAAANQDRVSDTLPMTFRQTISTLKLTSNPSVEVTEHIGDIVLESGAHTFQNAPTSGHPKSTLSIDGELIRSGAAAIIAWADPSSKPIVFTGATNTEGGIFKPWIIMGDWNPCHACVNENGSIKGASYVNFPDDADTDPRTLYSLRTDSYTLTRDQSVYGLRFYYNGADASLDLGSHTLRVGDGGLCLSYERGKTISASAGGQLVFTGPEIVLFGRCSNNAFYTIDAPIFCESETPPSLCAPSIEGSAAFRLRGEDHIGTYSNVMVNLCGSGSTEWVLGGPSDRTFLGTYSGSHTLAKEGPGTLTLACESFRHTSCGTKIREGRLVVANSKAMTFSTYDANLVQITNAVFEVATNVVVSGARMTFQNGSTFAGGGTVNFSAKPGIGAGVTLAPGSGVGTLSVSQMAFVDGARYEWEIGDGVDVPGTDYDLLNGIGTDWNNFSFNSGATATLAVSAAGSGWEKVRGKTFTIAQWACQQNGNTMNWNVVNLSPKKLITDNAVVTVDLKARKIYLSGLESYPSGTLLMLR